MTIYHTMNPYLGESRVSIGIEKTSLRSIILWIILFIGLSFSYTTSYAQDCTPSTLVKWSLSKEDPNCNNDISVANNGFNASSTSPQGCSIIDPGTVFRNQGGSSCVDGVDGNSDIGDAACTNQWTDNNWQDNSPKAVRFSLNSNTSQVGQISEVSFYEKAPTYDSRWGDINFPEKYGIRILKNGVQIFKQINISTTNSWSLESFDFSNNTDFQYTGNTVFEFELFAYDPSSNDPDDKYIWDLDDIRIKGCCGAPICDNITNAGTIGNDETQCGSYNPSSINSISPPSGGTGAVEYVWLMSTVECPDGTNGSVIPGANGPSYDPGTITETTWYRRCARRAGCSNFTGESNCVIKTVLDNPVITGVLNFDPSCSGNTGSIFINIVGDPANYAFNIGSGFENGQNIFNNLAAGTYNVSVRNLDGSCTVNYTSNPVVLNPAMNCNSAPVAGDDNFNVMEDSPLQGNVSLNDNDPDNDPLVFTILTGASNGMLTFNADGTFSYIPGLNFNGSDSFSYQVSDGVETDQAIVFINVLSTNDIPIALNDTNTTNEDTSVSGTVAANDSDPDNDPLTFAQISNPSSGQLIFNVDGTYTYIPNLNFNGTDMFTYQVDDGNGGFAQANVTISVLPSNDPPVALDDFETEEQDTQVNSTVAPNDSDPDNDPLTFLLLTQPNFGTLTFNPDGTYSFMPSSGFVGTTSFTYQISDGNGGTDQAEVTLTFTPCTPPNVNIQPFPNVCALEPILIAADDAGPGATYLWDFGPDATPSTSTSISETVIYGTQGSKTVSLTVTLNNCTAMEQATVNVTPAVTADGGQDQTICIGDAAQLGGAPTGPPGASFLWTPSTGLNNQTVSNPIASPTTTTTYTLFVTIAGCTRTADVTVDVAVMICRDTDKDGKPDIVDIDDDNDGILDIMEGEGVDPSADDDNDEIPNYADTDYPGFTDSNNDGVNDIFDKDDDGVPNHLDLDSDNDGAPDLQEAGFGNFDTNGDGTIGSDDIAGGDSDDDGLVDGLDPDNTGNPLPNPKDSDSDGTMDYLDLDADNDGVADVDESGNGDLDTNDDGIIDSNDFNGGDSDGDGIPNAIDTIDGFAAAPNSQNMQTDTDGDNIPDYQDLDSDNDGTTDVVEGGNSALDTNNNGVIDAGDTNSGDTDGDGLPDSIDQFVGPGNTDDSQGTGPDTDKDNVPDLQDADADNDGITDIIENGYQDLDINDNGFIDSNDPMGADSDFDGIPNITDGFFGPGAANNTQPPAKDSDMDGIPDANDLDSDNDGVADIVEAGKGLADSNHDGVIDQTDFGGGDLDKDGLADAIDDSLQFGASNGSQRDPNDADKDEVPDYIDLDSDNDGTTDVVEAGNGEDDTNGNGILDPADSNGGDSDQDGIPDAVDGFNGIGGDNGSQGLARDQDKDGTPDMLDIDSDNDGITDVIETGMTDLDTNNDGVISAADQNGGDSDKDGIADANDSNPNYGAANNSQGNEPDSDGDQIPDFLDIDSDNDAIADIIEGGNALADRNKDGIIDLDDNFGGDSDNDGLADIIDGNNGIGATPGDQAPARDADGDLTPDFRDLDSDNDGVSDVIEGGNETIDTNRDGIISDTDANGGDFDNDGLVNAIDNELGIGGSNGSQNNNKDFDRDGQMDFTDLDSDNDGIADIIEAGKGAADTNHDGILSTLDANGADSDGDGIPNIWDANNGMGANAGALQGGPDTDNDNTPDMLDLDSDNDGITDIFEAGYGSFDTNKDGFLSTQDSNGMDADNDGLINAIDANTGIGGAANSQNIPSDADGDGLSDFIDIDADNDGITDVVENGNASIDTNMDGVLNLLDTSGADQDGDGLVNAFDFSILVGSTPNSQGEMVNTDGDLVADYIDLDSDNDGIADIIEANYGDFDTNKDGTLSSIDSNSGDTDNDGLANVLDAFNGIGGAANSQGNELNSDGDALANYIDLDSDNDGITDLHEGGNGAFDTDGNGTLNTVDANGADLDLDGLVNAVDGLIGFADAANGQGDIRDTDNDLTPDFIDLDSDNDGLGDLAENGGNLLDTDRNGTISFSDDNGSDLDNDGLPNAIDGAIGFGVSFNSQGNFIDTDADLVPNYLDIDSDNDAISDIQEGINYTADSNFDGTVDLTDLNGDDNDFDGVPNVLDTYNGFGFAVNYHLNMLNTDGDGQLDYIDLDADNDGISDLAEGGFLSFDTNFDGVLTVADTGGIDTDGDGLADVADGSTGFADALNGQLIRNTDGDDNYDFQDIDADNDGIGDIHETTNFSFDTNKDGILSIADANGGDSDNDGLADAIDAYIGFGAAINSQTSVLDTDLDLVYNYIDLDADNDGIGDVQEAGFAIFDTNLDGTIDKDDTNGADTDGDGLADSIDGFVGFGDGNNRQGDERSTDDDGIPDYIDLDADNDGIADIIEAGYQLFDTNLNGTLDLLDNAGADLDNDGLANAVDGFIGFADNSNGQSMAADLDGDNVPNYLDLDTDNDGIPDLLEAGYAAFDTNQNGTAGIGDALGIDSDNDGIANAFDGFVGFADAINGQGNILDSDGDFVQNYMDLDSDNDGIVDLIENGYFMFDMNLNGTIELAESGDADGDGLMLAVDGFNGFGGLSFSKFLLFFGSDNTPNYIDLDSDNDGISDLTEGWGNLLTTLVYDASNDGILDGTDSDGDGLINVIDQYVGFANSSNSSMIPADEDGDSFYSYLDIDTDNDGILDNSEGQMTAAYIAPSNTDLDGDGIDDAYDFNTSIFGGGFRFMVIDTDMDEIPDYRDTNTDDDFEDDVIEGNDFDGDGIPELVPGGGDGDADGLLDNFDQNIGSMDATDGGRTPLSYPNADGNSSELDWREGLICINIQLNVLLEGALSDLNDRMTHLSEMRADMNLQRGILPGQTPTSMLVTGTPAGQPYDEAPWGYMGTEGANWTDAQYISIANIYGSEVVDWVLVSFRRNLEKSSQVGMTAALVLQDGRVVFVDECALTSTEPGPVYIVVEHRNHLGIMTNEPIDILAGNLTYDFTTTNTYMGMAPTTGFGQKQISDGRYVMYAGDNAQIPDLISYDINGMDKILWTVENGNFDNYLPSDFDMNGDVTGGDKILWSINNGVASRVPK